MREGLGLTADDDEFRMTFVGEIFLEAGTHRLVVDADDFAVLEIGTLSPVQIVASLSETTTHDVTVGSEGWFEFRAALHDRGGPAELSVEHTPPGGTPGPISPSRFRIEPRLAGREVWSWDDTNGRGEPLARRLDFDTTNRDYGAGNPGDLGLADDGWTARWVGRVQLGANPSLFLRSDDRHRVWLDGVFLGGADALVPSEATYTTGAPAGWHDLVLELSDAADDAELRCTIDGATLTAERFEPRTRFGGEVYAVGAVSSLTVGVGEAASEMVALVAPDGRPTVAPTAVFSASHPSSLRVALTGPHVRVANASAPDASLSWPHCPPLYLPVRPAQHPPAHCYVSPRDVS